MRYFFFLNGLLLFEFFVSCAANATNGHSPSLLHPHLTCHAHNKQIILLFFIQSASLRRPSFTLGYFVFGLLSTSPGQVRDGIVCSVGLLSLCVLIR
jgi:hypothetical protein